MDASKIPNSLEKPDVFASEATKRGAVWTKAMCDWVIATAHSNNDKADIKAFLDAANGIVDESTYKYVMATYNSVNGRKEDLPGKIRDVDFITPIKEKYIGEFINTYNNTKFIMLILMLSLDAMLIFVLLLMVFFVSNL